MKSYKLSKHIYTLIGFILLFAIWFVIAEIIGEKKLIFPGPIETIKDFFRLLKLKSTYISIGYSFYKMILGYLISIVMALIFGTISGLFDKVNKILYPTIQALKAIPTASLLFLFIVLSNFDNAPIYVVVLVSFPILYESFAGGIRNIPKTINEALMIDGGNRIGSIIKVKLPLAINYILVGIASSFSLAFKVEIMSEVLSGSTSYGIGCQIKLVQVTQTDMTSIFSWSLIAILFMLLITYLSNFINKKLIKDREVI